MFMTEQEAILTLNAIPGIGNAAIRDIRNYCGSASRVFALSGPELSALSVPAAVISKISEFDSDKFLKNEYNLIKKNGVDVLTCLDEYYPKLLKEIPDAPAVLYTKGNIALLDHPAIAMVGSRQSSVSGISIAEKFAMQLSERGVSIVSGMARGIDTASHRGCLRARGITIAVVGCGFEHIYPPENKVLFEEISQKGLILSEFPMEMPPLAQNFPRRNRIISGLSLGVIVVEAAMRSGALVTARMALEQGREVFAIPGPIDRPSSQGVNDLIKQGAKLTTCVDDVMEELAPALRDSLSGWQAPAEIEREAQPVLAHAATIGLTQQEQVVYNRISKDPIHVDDLLSECVDASAMGVLLQLELKHLVKQLPGKMFVRSI